MPLRRAPAVVLPPRLEGLTALSTNLSWSWNRDARELFRSIDPPTWRRVRHNPIELLRETPPSRLMHLAQDAAFVQQYDRVMEWFAADQQLDRTWFARRYPSQMARPVAYFCAEFGLHNSVPIYSGGLGILAGDHCKTASDLGVPLVGVGLSYMKGYFDQRLRGDGWQEDSDDHVDPSLTPLVELHGPKNESWLAVVQTFGRPVHVRAWTLRAGRVSLYLLDTNLEVNHPDDRTLLNKLYGGGPDLRLRQEWLLGVAGVRVLRAVGIEPGVWHANEGHASFMMLERVRERIAAGASWSDAVAEVRRSTVFTTHTPVPAGHDAFEPDQILQCIGPVWEEMGTTPEQVLALGRHPSRPDPRFQMTVLALRLASRVNGVSQRHGQVSREIWHDLWPGQSQDTVPIGAITNGVHLATWMANPVMKLLDRHFGPDWGARLDDPGLWDQLQHLDPGALWSVHQEVKGTLMGFIREEARRRFADEWTEASQVVAAGTLLHPRALTIGFARRFATYKRASLIFRDEERLKRLLCDKRRPVQIIFAGKAHPADKPGKEILQEVYRWTHNPFFQGRVAFLEDYDMHLAHVLAQGVDLWMNLPRVPLEACGTSGMKAALNGVPQLGTIDGWWEEGYDGTNGWAIPVAPDTDDLEVQDAHDAENLYRVLEEEIVPLYYAQDAAGLSPGWADVMRNAIRVAGSRFTARRMLIEYAEKYYVPVMRGVPFPTARRRDRVMAERRSEGRGLYPHSALFTPGGEPVTVVHLAAEYYPYARSGGLAEAVANLARFQSAGGMRSIAFLPLYRSARAAAGELVPVGEPFRVRAGTAPVEVRILRQAESRNGTQLYFVEQDGYFDRERLYGDARGDYADNHLRFACFALAALEAIPRLVDGPALLHAHDWHAALAPVYLRTRYADDPRYRAIRAVLSVHNAGYQGHHPPSVIDELGLPWDLFTWRHLEWYGKVNLLKGGLVFADQVVTVSPNHVHELRTAGGGFGLQEVFEWLGSRFSGILNGIDQQAWDPATDPLIPETFTIDDVSGKAACKATVQRSFSLGEHPRMPLFSMAARLVTQKGIDLILNSPALFSLGAQFVFIGAGEARFEEALSSLASRQPERIAINTDFTDRLEHLLISGADFLLMPCQYEPCGLTQMRAQRYGAIPVVRRVGGLADTVTDGATGFVFEPYHAEPLLGAALRGLDCYSSPPEWARMRRNAMRQDWGWERSVERYLDVYQRALAGAAAA